MCIPSRIRVLREVTGFFGDNNPLLLLQFSEPQNPDERREIECLIDTGYTGFLSLSVLELSQLSLKPHTTARIRFANGAVETRFVCLGTVHLYGIERVGDIEIEPNSNESIVGIEFLRIFKLGLYVNPNNGQIKLTPHL